jgi:Immunity protein 52
MKEHVFMGAYWGCREETRHECARRIVDFLASIASQECYSAWYPKTWRKRAAADPLELSVEAMAAALRVQGRDIGGGLIPELGYSLGVWNGRDDDSASFMATCGAFSRYVTNAVVLTLGQRDPPQGRAGGVPFFEILQNMVSAFDPDDAVLTSNEFIERSGFRTPAEAGGWIVYRRGGGFRETD